MRKTVYVFFGMIATGKSSLAQTWAEREGCLYLNSDIVRKQLAGKGQANSSKTAFDQGIYSSFFSRLTYDELLRRTKMALAEKTDCCVVLDASYQSIEERNRLREALEQNCRLLFLYCYCSEKTIRKRLELRSHDVQAVSDGRWEIYLSQKERFAEPFELEKRLLIRINTEGPLEELHDKIKCTLRDTDIMQLNID